MTHKITPASIEDAHELAQNLRAADLRELDAFTGGDPLEALIDSIAASPVAWTWRFEGRVMAIFGASPWADRPGVGSCWLLACEEAAKHRMFFWRQARKFVNAELEHFSVLENYVDCRHTAAIQWLAWCGASFVEMCPFFGRLRTPFLRFQLSRGP